jgi:hypothetical protein
VIQASCHCGAAQIEVDTRPRSLTACNCSICRRLAALWAYYTRREARLSSPPSSVSAYVWGDRVIEFYHCNTCGCPTHYESVDKGIGSRFAVNARCMSEDAIAGVVVRKFDGASSWQYID